MDRARLRTDRHRGLGPRLCGRSRRLGPIGTALGLVAVLALLAAIRARLPAAAAAAEAAPTPAPAPTPDAGREDTRVLLELFTSEGCASCPPAEDIARALARSQRIAGARVILLAHHVDYWNELGWPDPFASADATRRQRSYAHARGGLYTPQAIIDGSSQIVGSREAAIERALADAARRPHLQLALGVRVGAPPRGPFDVEVTVPALPESASEAELLVASVQDRATLTVPRGANAGRTLEHVAIARAVQTVGDVARGGGSLRAVVPVPAAIAAPASSFSVVAFVQERTSRRILGSATAPLR